MKPSISSEAARAASATTTVYLALHKQSAVSKASDFGNASRGLTMAASADPSPLARPQRTRRGFYSGATKQEEVRHTHI
jgi:hypothetical protein